MEERPPSVETSSEAPDDRAAARITEPDYAEGSDFDYEDDYDDDDFVAPEPVDEPRGSRSRDSADRGTRPEEIDYTLGRLSSGAREREYRTYALLGLLGAVAGAAVAAGAAVDNPIFWGVAATVFFMAMAGLVAYAAKGLGIFAEMAELIRLRHQRSSAD